LSSLVKNDAEVLAMMKYIMALRKPFGRSFRGSKIRNQRHSGFHDWADHHQHRAGDRTNDCWTGRDANGMPSAEVGRALVEIGKGGVVRGGWWDSNPQPPEPQSGALAVFLSTCQHNHEHHAVGCSSGDRKCA